MHILVGALIGCVCGVVGTVIVSLVMHKRITWKTIAAGAVGGLIGGAITSATLGAGGIAAATAARSATAYIAGGAGGSGSAKVYENLVDEQPVMKGVTESVAIGAATGVFSYGAARIAEPVLRRAAPGFADVWFGETAPPPPSVTTGMAKALDAVDDGVNGGVSGGAR